MFDKILQFFVKLLPAPLKKLYDKFEELIVYIYYGVLTTILNLIVQFAMQFGVMALVSWDAKLETTISTSTAWLVAVIFAFYVNKRYVFKSESKAAGTLAYEFLTFVGARALSYFMELGIMIVGTFFYHDAATDTDNPWIYFIFKFTAQVVVTLANYFFSKLIVFRKKKDVPDADVQPEEAK
ncbi:MAG: GtrA family protein [Oscillospiraceae bacterium]|jgi:putative flippase GtrA|nr:GtrA family protein [Oscillospiraceae bacterium]MBR2099458.1 GtrA family protein [Bacillota bacterium]